MRERRSENISVAVALRPSCVLHGEEIDLGIDPDRNRRSNRPIGRFDVPLMVQSEYGEAVSRGRGRSGPLPEQLPSTSGIPPGQRGGASPEPAAVDLRFARHIARPDPLLLPTETTPEGDGIMLELERFPRRRALILPFARFSTFEPSRTPNARRKAEPRDRRRTFPARAYVRSSRSHHVPHDPHCRNTTI